MPKQKKTMDVTINVFDKEELSNWSKKLGCDREELINAILTAGKSVKDVKKFLKGGWKGKR